MSLFHEGELNVQTKAGTTLMAEKVAQGRREDASLYAAFVEKTQFAAASTSNKQNHVWASALTGELGFISLVDSKTVRINPTNDTLFLQEQLEQDARLGLIVINPKTRGRARLNGHAHIDNGSIILTTEEVYGNCPKYIQTYTLEHKTRSAQAATSTSIMTSLTQDVKAQLERAHTFFIASNHPTGKADISHRGGQAGFVHLNGNELRFPDYAGNQMFNTLGNIQSNPNVGLLFNDFSTGDSLQLRGQARILWDEKDYANFKGAERAVSVDIEEIRYTKNALPLKGELLEYSPHNP